MRYRTGFASYLAGTAYYEESARIDPGTLDALVTRLRGGDTSVIDTIIRGHLKLTAALVASKVRSRRKFDDAMGAALLALTKAVHDARTRLYDNQITAYITTCVKYAVKDEIANLHVVRVSPRTIRDRIARGDDFKSIVPGASAKVEAGIAESGSGEDAVRRRGEASLPFVVPIAPRLVPTPEFSEALQKAAVTPMEQAIVKLRSEGYGYEEIGRKVGYGKTRVGEITNAIEARFDALYGAGV